VCINFKSTNDNAWVSSNFGVDLPQNYSSEIYPGLSAPIIVKSRQSGRMACGLARFGLIPAWARDEKIGRYTANARSETVADKPSYRAAWRKGQYGLVLVDCFYEPNYQSGQSVRWQIGIESETPFAIACLWEQWTDSNSGEVVVSFTILTANADDHPVMSQFHKVGDEKRTPIILSSSLHHEWLEADMHRAQELIASAHMSKLRAVPASKM
jgi:putative SOS response-associated peptidase YedK